MVIDDLLLEKDFSQTIGSIQTIQIKNIIPSRCIDNPFHIQIHANIVQFCIPIQIQLLLLSWSTIQISFPITSIRFFLRLHLFVSILFLFFASFCSFSHVFFHCLSFSMFSFTGVLSFNGFSGRVCFISIVYFDNIQSMLFVLSVDLHFQVLSDLMIVVMFICKTGGALMILRVKSWWFSLFANEKVILQNIFEEYVNNTNQIQFK